MDLGSSEWKAYEAAESASHSTGQADQELYAAGGKSWFDQAALAHVKSIGGSENLTSPEKAKRQAKKKNKGGSRPQALIPEKKIFTA